MTVVASFYAPRPDHPRHRYDFLDCLALQRASCERYACRQMVITDAALGDLETFPVDLPQDLMPAILAGQLALLESGIDEDLLLVGADCLLGRSPLGAPMFDTSVDLAVTTHPFADCILNTGMIAVPAGCASRVAPIWRAALARCGTQWGDDQLALAAIIGPTLVHGIECRTGLALSLRIMFLPAADWNAAPDSVDHDIDPLIVHFRGPRKAWMRDWAARHG